MEGNQVLDGESVKYGSLQKVDNDTYSDQVAAIKKRYGLKEGVSNVIFDDRYAFIDPTTGEQRFTRNFDQAQKWQSDGLRVQGGGEQDKLITIYRSAFAADIEQVNIGGTTGFTDFKQHLSHPL